MNAPVIQVSNLEFRWRSAPDACLRIPQFELAHGESVFLHGPSGSGKSTLLGLLGGVITPQEGVIRILGRDLGSLGSAARDRLRVDHIGFVFQQFNLIPYLSVIDNVLLPCRFSARRRERAGSGGLGGKQEASRLLGRLDMPASLWNRPVTQLSVGQQQRVAVARALIGRPEIIVADEPTSSLDAQRQSAFLDLLRQECAGACASLLFVSHDMRLAAAFDRVVALADINRATTQGDGP